MLLLHITNKNKWNSKEDFFLILKHRDYILALKNKLFLLQKLKQQKSIKNLKPVVRKSTSKVIVKHDLVNYIINIVLTNKNTLIYVTPCTS